MAVDLQTKLGIKDFDAMVQDTLQSVIDSNVGITNTSVGSAIRTIIESILDNVDALNYYIEYVYGAMGIDEATGDDLDRLVIIFGIVRNSATKAKGTVTFSTGDEPYAYDISIPYGHIIATRQASDGTYVEFIVVDEDLILPAGTNTIDVNVEAVNGGHVYLPPKTLCVLSNSIVGIQSVYNENEINDGKDTETDVELRQRTKDVVASFGKCTDDSIKTSIENIDGVASCVVKDQYAGIGTTGVIAVTNIMPPSDEMKTAIESMVAETKASGIKAIIIYPTVIYLDIDISVDDTEHDEDILEAISDYVDSLEAGQTFVIKQMERKILNVLDNNTAENDDLDITTNSPTENKECTDEQIIRVSSVTINEVEYNV